MGEPCQQDSDRIKTQRVSSLHIVADSNGQPGSRTLQANETALEYRVRQSRHNEHKAVHRGGQRREVIFSGPVRHEGHQGEPEEQMEIGPENLAVHAVARLEHVMMIVPINTEENKTQNV